MLGRHVLLLRLIVVMFALVRVAPGSQLLPLACLQGQQQASARMRCGELQAVHITPHKAMLSWRCWSACRAHLLIQHLLRRELCAGAGEAPLPLWGETHRRRGRLLHGSDPLRVLWVSGCLFLQIPSLVTCPRQCSLAGLI